MAISLQNVYLPLESISVDGALVRKISVGDQLIWEPLDPNDHAPYTVPFSVSGENPQPAPNLALTSVTSHSLSVIASYDSTGGVFRFNFYLNGVRHSPTPLASGAYTYGDLDDGTGYELSFRLVNDLGVESDRYGAFTASTTVEEDLPTELRNAVADIVSEEMALSKAPGVAVAISGPRGSYIAAFGDTAATGGRPVTVDDHFRIASSTKIFTSTAVLMAVERGDISLDDKLSTYVPNVPNGNLITIRDMMMMRSGVYDYQSNLWWAVTFALLPGMAYNDDAILLFIQGNPSSFTPGTRYQYTNSNYVLLGLVLKAATGRSVRDIIIEDILNPLGLTETKWPTDAYMPQPAGGTTNWNPGFFGAAGAIVSTVGDMLKWAAELRDSTLLGPELNELRKTLFYGYDSGAKPPMPATFGYGLGMESTGTWLGHNGSLPGWDCQLAYDTVSGATIAVAENMQTVTPNVLSSYTRIFARIAEYLYPGSMDEQEYAPG